MKRLSRKPIPLYVQILVGMAAGIVLGIVAVAVGGNAFVTLWIKPFGEIFIRLLKLVAVPLVIFSLIKGVGGLNDIGRFSRIGIRTLLIYLGTTVFSVSLGLLLVHITNPGRNIEAESLVQIQAQYGQAVSEKSASAAVLQEVRPLQFLVDMVPENILGALGTNANMLQVIFVALFIGLAVVLCGKTRTAAFMRLVDNLDVIVLKMVDMIMRFAPFGVLALMAGLVADSSGNLSLLGALGLYALTVVLGLLLLIFLFYPSLVYLFTQLPVRRFFRAMSPVQLLAFSTSSSAATLPLTLEVVERDLKIPNEIASFVLPVGVTINMDGTSCYQAIAAVFIAQVMGVPLGLPELLTIVATTTLSSIGTPAIPGGSVVILLMVLSSVGVPPEGLALILGVDRPLDMLRTVVNVTGDATVATLVSSTQRNT